MDSHRHEKLPEMAVIWKPSQPDGSLARTEGLTVSKPAVEIHLRQVYVLREIQDSYRYTKKGWPYEYLSENLTT